MSPRRIHLVVAAIAGLQSFSAQAANVQITIEKLEISPAEARAKVGDTIEWINKDIVAHTATARSGDWDVMIAPRRSARIVLKKAGAVDYYCRFHPNMTGRLTVEP